MSIGIEECLLFCSRFDRAATVLGKRPHGRRPFELKTEYDVQDLVYAALKPLVDDLDLEDPTRKVSGRSGRLDIVSHELGLVIEAKAAFTPARARAIPGECFERIKLYSTVPNLNVLAFFIYDPNHRIRDLDNLPRGLEGDQLGPDGERRFKVRVVGPGLHHARVMGPALPVRRSHVSDADALNELASWFHALSDAERLGMIRFTDVDAKLGVPDGTAKRLLERALPRYEVSGRGDETIILKRKPEDLSAVLALYNAPDNRRLP